MKGSKNLKEDRWSRIKKARDNPLEKKIEGPDIGIFSEAVRILLLLSLRVIGN